MTARHKSLLHVKSTVVKGRRYNYFRTGQKNEKGKEILTPLPPLNDPGFGAAYAACLAHRTRRANTPSELTVTALCDLWEKSAKWTKPREDKGYAEGTKKLYRIGLDYFRKKLPTAPAGRLERSDIALLIDQRAAENPGSANSLLSVINTLYKWARTRGHVNNDPGRDIPYLEMGEHEPWPEHILEAGLKAKDPLVRRAVHVLYFTAQRINDAVKIPRAAIQSDVVPVKQMKTGKEILIPLHATLRAELATDAGSMGYLIPGLKLGKPIKADTLRDRIQAWAKENFNTYVVPHGLRKNAVNALLEAGCSAAQAAAISGQSLQMVEHYAKRRAQGKLASAAILLWEKNAK